MEKSSLLLTLTLIICFALSIKATSPPGTCTATANNELESNNLVLERREVYGGGRIFNISHQYTTNMPSWASTEGLGQFLWLTKSMKNGYEANFSEMKMPTHIGTHVDAPGHVFDHYFDAGFDVDTLDLEVLNGPALLVDVLRNKNLTGSDICASFNHMFWQILPNGCLVVKFPGRLALRDACTNFLADLVEVEAVSFDTCNGLFTAMKFGLFVGKSIGRSRKKKSQIFSVQGDGQHHDGQTSGKWLQNPVTNMFFCIHA